MARVQEQPADLTLNKYSLEYPFEALERATCNFDPSRKLGNGGFGAVYHGVQSDETDVAVKVLDMPAEAGFEEEVRVLSRFRHPNLVILMGFARRDSQRFLVYELLGGGDVHKRLERSTVEGAPFPWRQRVSAAFDAACGLSHLHNSRPKVFHRDIKSPNILLDRHGAAKMADFGLACLSHARTHRVESAAGTVGYACPLYSQRCVVTEGSEAYSFGVVLLELLTASPPAWVVRSPDGSERYAFLAGHVRGDPGVAASLADSGACWPDHVAYAMACLALHCIQSDDDQRPCFVDVVRALRLLRDSPDSCTQPGMRSLEHPSPASARGPHAVEAWHPQGNASAFPAAVAEASAPAEMPKLWSLECEYAEGLDAVPARYRSLAHLWEPGVPLLTLFKVGRLLQEDFFQAVLAEEAVRNMVSREHFQIWATRAGGESALEDDDLAPGSVPCSFFVANLSRTWTMVNGTLLDGCGKCMQLHHGDRIAIGRSVATAEGVRHSPLVGFRFDLGGSVLCDASAQEVGSARSKAEAAAPPRVPTPVPPAADDLRRATSLAGDVVPQFLLQVGGTGVLEGAEGAHRLIAHGRPAQASGAFLPLVLGSGHATGFWRRLLSGEALSAMAPEHVAFEPACSAEPGVEAPQVAVRSRSYAHAVFVHSGSEKDCVHAVDPGERRLLEHGDRVVIVAAQHCSVWLVFWDLAALRNVAAAGGA